MWRTIALNWTRFFAVRLYRKRWLGRKAGLLRPLQKNIAEIHCGRTYLHMNLKEQSNKKYDKHLLRQVNRMADIHNNCIIELGWYNDRTPTISWNNHWNICGFIFHLCSLLFILILNRNRMSIPFTTHVHSTSGPKSRTWDSFTPMSSLESRQFLFPA